MALRLGSGRRFSIALAVVGLLALSTGVAAGASPRVVVLPTTGIVDAFMAGYLHDGIAQAAREGAAAVVLEIDTPGGSLDATRDIVKSLLEAPLPVITWVAPPGSRAASAGTFITEAGNLALMAPATNIGAAAPVDSLGQDIPGTLGQKILNDAAASMASVTEERGRNASWAVTTVREAKSYTASEALASKGIDGIAGTLDEVLAFANGRTVDVGGKPVTLDLAGATTETVTANPIQGVLHLLADPNVAFILFVIGVFGLLLELVHPSLIAGIVGGLALLASFVGFGSLPLNVAGLVLVVAALALFAVDLFVTSHGLLTVGAVVLFVLGTAILYTQAGPTTPDVAVSWPIIVVMAGITVVFMVFVLSGALRVRRMARTPIGLGGGAGGRVPLGTIGEVRRPLEPIGSVVLESEEWTARSVDGAPLDRKTPIRVVGQDGLTVIVERTAPAGLAAQKEGSPT
jgi:membrane-bound serine protease (ClpP class)